MLLHLVYISLIVTSLFLITDGSHYLMRSNHLERNEENMCIPQPSLIDIMGQVIVKLDQMSDGQKKILSKLKLSKKDTEELLRGQKRLEKLIKDK